MGAKIGLIVALLIDRECGFGGRVGLEEPEGGAGSGDLRDDLFSDRYVREKCAGDEGFLNPVRRDVLPKIKQTDFFIILQVAHEMLKRKNLWKENLRKNSRNWNTFKRTP